MDNIANFFNLTLAWFTQIQLQLWRSRTREVTEGRSPLLYNPLLVACNTFFGQHGLHIFIWKKILVTSILRDTTKRMPNFALMRNLKMILLSVYEDREPVWIF